eukprot:COSAG05_NODE_14333_length_399_cov_14.203333_1_plen_54_part_01
MFHNVGLIVHAPVEVRIHSARTQTMFQPSNISIVHAVRLHLADVHLEWYGSTAG